MNFKDGLMILLIIMLVALLMMLPFATIWGFNQLFPSSAVPYTWRTYLGVTLLGAFFSSSAISNGLKK